MENLDTDMAKEYLICVGFLIVFTTQTVFFTGHLYFYVKGYEFATVEGTSMLPTLKNGQTAIINCNIPEGNLTSMILVFGDRNICHRCVKDEGQWLTFKGDNNSFLERVTRDELKAVFVKVSQNPFLDSVILGLQ